MTMEMLSSKPLLKAMHVKQEPTQSPPTQTKPRLSLVERQSLQNTSQRPSSTTSRRRSNLHPPQPSGDIFRFSSESPPKPPTSPPKHTSSPPKWPPTITGRERRRTFNLTMEKIAHLAREEESFDSPEIWEKSSKRRRQ